MLQDQSSLSDGNQDDQGDTKISQKRAVTHYKKQKNIQREVCRPSMAETEVLGPS